jgi:hypothetical protein
MGVHTLRGDDQACMFCSTTDWAFGPVFSDDGNHSAEERIESFLRWFRTNGSIPPLYYDDPRQLTDSELESKYSDWRAQEEAQWQAEEDAEKARWNEDE